MKYFTKPTDIFSVSLDLDKVEQCKQAARAIIVYDRSQYFTYGRNIGSTSTDNIGRLTVLCRTQEIIRDLVQKGIYPERLKNVTETFEPDQISRIKAIHKAQFRNGLLPPI